MSVEFVEDRIRDVDTRRHEALLAADADRLEALLHDQLVYTHSTGAVEHKSEMVAKLREGRYVYHSIEHPIQEIVIVGSTALVLQRMRVEVSVDGRLLQLSSRSLAVWVEDDGEWRLLAFQPTPVPRDV